MLLACDIGGTNIRIRLVDETGFDVRGLHTEIYKTSEFASLEAALRRFVSDYHLGGKIDRIICGIPGDVVNNTVTAIFLKHWGTVDGSHVRTAIGARECVILNDLHCAAFSMNSISEDDLVCLRPGRMKGGNVKALIAVGTGLGVSLCMRESDGLKYNPFASEAGWIRFTPSDSTDSDFMRFLMRKHSISQICYGHVCSGTGLLDHYEFLARDRSNNIDSAEAICASFKDDLIARAAVSNMIRYLGRFISQLCLIFKPTGGIYLTGGAMSSLGALITTSNCFESGLNEIENDILLEICQAPSIYQVTREDLGLIGASCFALER